MKKQQYNIRLDSDLLRGIRDKAKRDNTTVTEIIETSLYEILENDLS